MGTINILAINILIVLGGIALPLAAAIAGFILWRDPPEINSKFGFRTKHSTKNELAWHFAQTLSGKLMISVFAPMTVISAVLCVLGIVNGFDSGKKFLLISGLIFTDIFLMILVNICVDCGLKKHVRENALPEDGNER